MKKLYTLKSEIKPENFIFIKELEKLIKDLSNNLGKCRCIIIRSK